MAGACAWTQWQQIKSVSTGLESKLRNKHTTLRRSLYEWVMNPSLEFATCWSKHSIFVRWLWLGVESFRSDSPWRQQDCPKVCGVFCQVDFSVDIQVLDFQPVTDLQVGHTWNRHGYVQVTCVLFPCRWFFCFCFVMGWVQGFPRSECGSEGKFE